MVTEGSTALRVSQSGNGAPALVLTNIKAPKNGYAYVYVSNESDEMVYFDNLQVSDVHGRIIEENHYYAYGLRIAGISSKKLADANEGQVGNFNLYNDKELIEEADLEWYDYGFRSYDAQIGRFMQLDPLTDDYPFYAPYQFAGCEPIGNVDVDGLEPANVTSFAKNIDGAYISALKNGGWAVSWNTLGEGRAMLFKATAKAASATVSVASIATKTLDVATNFVPIVSGAKDIYQGVRDGNYWQVGIGVVSLGLDFLTLGSSSVIKGAIKTAVVESAEIIAKDAAEKLVQKELLQATEKSLVKAGKEGSQLLLKPGAANLTQEGLDHIVARHWFSSEAKGAGKFLKGTTGSGLKNMINTTTTQGVFRANTMGRAGTIAEYNFGRVIGTTSSGASASRLRTVIGTNGNIITAFPF